MGVSSTTKGPCSLVRIIFSPSPSNSHRTTHNMYDIIIGTLLISSWINCMLYILEIHQLWSYFNSYAKDRWCLKGMVLTCFLLDTLCTVGNCVGVYKSCITYWGVVEYLGRQEWQLPLYVITTGLVAVIVQTFLIHRLFRLQKSWIVAAGLGILVVVSLAGNVATTTVIAMASSLSDPHMVKIPVIIWFVVSAVVDCSITAFLIHALRSYRTGFKTTHDLINRLTSLAIQTGSITSVVALVIMIVYVANSTGNIANGLAQCLGRVYTLTLLNNLHSRGKMTETICNESAVVETLSLSGIHVHRTAVVQVDDTPTYSSGRKEPRRKTLMKQKSDDESLAGEVKSVPIA